MTLILQNTNTKVILLVFLYQYIIFITSIYICSGYTKIISHRLIIDSKNSLYSIHIHFKLPKRSNIHARISQTLTRVFLLLNSISHYIYWSFAGDHIITSFKALHQCGPFFNLKVFNHTDDQLNFTSEEWKPLQYMDCCWFLASLTTILRQSMS
jgi:hypothetical protein